MQTITAVYEGGVFRPLAPVNLAEHQEVVLRVQTQTIDELVDREFMKHCAEYEGPIPTLEDVRQITSKIPQPLTELIRQERDER